MRAILLVMDSFGIGAAPDAAKFGDDGADTFGHIAAFCSSHARADGATRPLVLPNLYRLGLGEAYALVHDAPAPGYEPVAPVASWGAMREISTGKDTTSGHWEMAGLPALFTWGYFTDKTNSFPPELLRKAAARGRLPGFLGNCHSSGLEILETYGEEHMRTGKPIIYTSVDSVFQIACHEETFGLQRLYDLCRIVFEEIAPWHIGRVIARPFVGCKPGEFRRTGNRRDFAVKPPGPTILTRLTDAGGTVTAVGKISDIFAGEGVSRHLKATGIEDLWDATLRATRESGERSLVFSNFVDFDQTWGHRRDVPGYAAALEQFDRRIPELLALLTNDDMLIITADHGCDPTWTGTDHTRECVPVLVFSPAAPGRSLGIRSTYADVAQSLAGWFGLPPFDTGSSFPDAGG
ncbi:MAG: phosphopentomutase [Methylobacteriaceae bacterium]|jgi:phosphopentomutase|nr:phosphopentomutase [Methylobacteriaceae bacterium]